MALYIGSEKVRIMQGCIFTNMLGALGDMENGTIYKTTNETNYVKNSSQKKYGSSSQAWQQTASAAELKYELKNSTGVLKFKFNPTHKYYFSMWLMHRTSLNMKADVYWGSTAIYTGRGNTALNAWTHHSVVFQWPNVANDSYPLMVSSTNYPGNNAAMNIDGLMLIDLTAACGVGNEPTKEWCDANLTFTTSAIVLASPATIACG